LLEEFWETYTEGSPDDALAQELEALLSKEEWAAAHEIYEEKGVEAARDWFDEWPQTQREEYYPGVFDAELEVPPKPKRIKRRGGRVEYAGGGKIRRFTRRDVLKGGAAGATVAGLGLGKAGVKKGLPEVAPIAPLPDAPKWDRLPTDSKKTIGTGGKGNLRATIDEIIELFGEPDEWLGEGDGKTTVEWDLEMEDGSIVTIYDYKDFDSWADEMFYDRKLGKMKWPRGISREELHEQYLLDMQEWHVGGTKDAIKNLKRIVGDMAETDKEYMGRKHPSMFNDEGDLMAEGGRVEYAGGGKVAAAVKKLRAARRQLTESSDPDIEYIARELESIAGAESLGKRMRHIISEGTNERYTPMEQEHLWERLMQQFDETIEKADPEGAAQMRERVGALVEGRNDLPRWSEDLDEGAKRWIEAEAEGLDLSVDEFLEEAFKQRSKRRPGPIQGI